MYPKNAASPPKLFATVVKAADGTAITSGVAAKYSTGAGSQAAGGGTCQHEGNGQWSYTPTQAETNVDGFGVQFYHADAVGSGPTISIVTTANVVQTGDSYARLGAPAGASVSADIAALPTAVTIADSVWDEALADHNTEDTIGNVLNDLTEESGTYRFTAGALSQGPGGGGTTYSYTTTVDDGSGNLLDGVFVECATDSGFTNVIYTTHTNALGSFTVYSDTTGTHYLRLQLAGYTFATQTVTLT